MRSMAGICAKRCACRWPGWAPSCCCCSGIAQCPARRARDRAAAAGGAGGQRWTVALAGIRLTILHLIGMLLIVAVGSNYALFFDRRAADRDRTRAAV